MSSRKPPRASDQGLLIRALERGDERAIEPLLDRHLPEVYGLLRMILATADEAEQALTEAFCVATERADDPLARTDPAGWLLGIALEQAESRARPPTPISMRERRQGARASGSGSGAAAPLDADSVSGVTDRALGVVIRTLELRRRQALVLGVVCRLEDSRVAAVVGCRRDQVERLKRAALADVAERLREHEQREQELKRQIAAVPYELRPIPAAGDGRGTSGSTVVVGTKVHLEPAQELSLLALVRRALKRLTELFRHRRDAAGLSDESADSKPQRSPEPTPSLAPFERPKSTPSIQGHRSPKLSPGVAVYTMPRGTPTTRRISSKRRPLPPTER